MSKPDLTLCLLKYLVANIAGADEAEVHLDFGRLVVKHADGRVSTIYADGSSSERIAS